MRLEDFRVLACVSCGRSDGPLRRLPEALNVNVRACEVCWARFGEAALTREADELLANAQSGRVVALGAGVCLHCGEPVPALAGGGYAAWCSACERERRAMMTR